MVQQVGSLSSLLAGTVGRRVMALRHHQHPSGPLPLHTTPIWRGLSTSIVSEVDGHGVAGNTRGRLLL